MALSALVWMWRGQHTSIRVEKRAENVRGVITLPSSRSSTEIDGGIMTYVEKAEWLFKLRERGEGGRRRVGGGGQPGAGDRLGKVSR